ncbi:unnamed protein product, partial [Effrenium voratum]
CMPPDRPDVASKWTAALWGDAPSHAAASLVRGRCGWPRRGGGKARKTAAASWRSSEMANISRKRRDMALAGREAATPSREREALPPRALPGTLLKTNGRRRPSSPAIEKPNFAVPRGAELGAETPDRKEVQRLQEES